MMAESSRVYEIAKELGLTNKDVLEKLEKIDIKVKSHSATLTFSQIQRLKEFLKTNEKVEVKRPKAFIVKKAKPVEQIKEEEPKKDVEENNEGNENTTSIKILPPQKPKVDIRSIIEARQRPFLKEKKSEQQQKSTTILPPRRSEFKKFEKPKVEGERNNDKAKEEVKKTKSVPDKQKQPIKRTIITQDMYANQSGARKKGKYQKEHSARNKEELQEMISLEKAMNQKHKKKIHEEEIVAEIKEIVLNNAISVGDLSIKINKSPAEIVKFLMMEGILATVNQIIDINTVKKVCESFEINVLEEDLEAYVAEELKKEEKIKEQKAVDAKLLTKRAPVISIMGHVDHGKTTLLDSIRASKHKIVATEVGGITQSIGAYTVNINEKKIVFIDTPGHEAFTEMRARGAKSTDIAILVVAADDGIMPQTIEAINHAKAADVPIIVAVNKCDKQGANPDKILQQLTEHGLVPEEWGGETICCKVSALQKSGIDELLEYILLVADMQDLKANRTAKASGVVIEANLDKGKGPVATFLVQNGTLKTGDCIVVGTVCGKARALLSDSGERVKKAGPSTPVEILGLTEVPQAGDKFEVVANEKEMKQISAERKEKERISKLELMTPSNIHNKVVGEGNEKIKNLNLIIKANTHGSAEAVSQAISQIQSDEIIVKLVHVGVGDISEADIMLASASDAIVLGFGVKEDNNAGLAAEKENVQIKKYDIIYQILDDIEATMLKLLEPEIKQVDLGKAEVRAIFTVGKTTKIAGCYVIEGKIVKGKTAKVLRNNEKIFEGKIDQLKRFKDDVKEVSTGFECGISFDKFNDLQEGDIIEVSTTKEVDRVSL